MKYKYVILDDDSKSILKTQSVMECISNVTCIGSASTYDDGLNLILKHRPDFVFLEINPQIKSSNLSLLLLNELHRYLKNVPKFIAISTDTSLAYEALKYDVEDFLLKPLSEADIIKTFLRIEKKEGIDNTCIESSTSSISKPIADKTEFTDEIPDIVTNVLQNPVSRADNALINESIQSLKVEISKIKDTLQKNVLPNNTSIDPNQLKELIVETISKNLPAQKETDWLPVLNKLNEFTIAEKGPPENHEENQRNLICIKSYGDYRFLELDDLAYLQADNNSTDITLKNGEQITAFKTLKYFEENLPSNFYRIHNSYIVNKNYISRIHTGNSLCYIKNSKNQIPFSKSYKDNIDLILAQLAGSEFKES